MASPWYVAEIYDTERAAKGLASGVKARHDGIKTRVRTLDEPIRANGRTFQYVVEWAGVDPQGTLPKRTEAEASAIARALTQAATARRRSVGSRSLRGT